MTMRKLAVVAVMIVAATTVLTIAQTRKTLDIYLIDVEGGNATLFVPPSGETVLIDTGNGGAAAMRDGDRIMAAVKDAGISQINHLITTHWHGDHFGAMENVAGRIPVREFIDHGANVQPGGAVDEFLQKTYPALYAKGKHRVVKPGDKVAVAGLEWHIVAAGGEAIKSSLSGAGKPNPYCAAFKPQDVDRTENAQSVGSHVTFGKFRVLHLGDLTVNKEFDLMCPTNRLGTVDLWVVSHHGQAISNSEVLVHAIQPRVAILNNGTRKGGQPDAMKIIHSAPRLQDLWQLHFSQLSGQEYTVPGMFIANPVDEQPAAIPIAAIVAPAPGAGAAPPPPHNGQAYWIKVSAEQDGSFTVTNARNGFTKTYKAGI
jgi:competence protein ComEC